MIKKTLLQAFIFGAAGLIVVAAQANAIDLSLLDKLQDQISAPASDASLAQTSQTTPQSEPLAKPKKTTKTNKVNKRNKESKSSHHHHKKVKKNKTTKKATANVKSKKAQSPKKVKKTNGKKMQAKTIAPKPHSVDRKNATFCDQNGGVRQYESTGGAAVKAGEITNTCVTSQLKITG
ncbi:hypothetical protein MUU49_14650 [Scandinavium goeteborgense]|uniref:hypothetical protein n=1 Tax=Scandinavium goeteborgense TaxID=1851514 RepID=UPI0021651EE9|nr:hypothetical protein [Scandinavium goeteborgense]MCS2153795.1 hypothetical protein [Scandinavium goeteborgense]